MEYPLFATCCRLAVNRQLPILEDVSTEDLLNRSKVTDVK